MSSRQLSLSVVIPTMGRSTVIRTVESLLSTGFDGMEILVCGKVPDVHVAGQLKRLVEMDGRVKHYPVQYRIGDSSRKKNYGAEQATADIIGFMDDDVVVVSNWPELVLQQFENEMVGLVSGPSLVPDDINFCGRLAGLALSSGAAGYVAERYLKGGQDARQVDWDRIIGCNAAYRRSVFEAIGGFPSEFYPGEEMISAFRAEQLGAMLRFIPEASVEHYPRQSVARFCRQMWTYGATRIRLIRAGVGASVLNLAPAAFVALIVVLSVGSVFSFWAALALSAMLFIYALMTLYFSIIVACRTRRASDVTVWGMILVMHVCYGAAEWYEWFRPNRDWSEKVFL